MYLTHVAIACCGVVWERVKKVSDEQNRVVETKDTNGRLSAMISANALVVAGLVEQAKHTPGVA